MRFLMFLVSTGAVVVESSAPFRMVIQCIILISPGTLCHFLQFRGRTPFLCKGGSVQDSVSPMAYVASESQCLQFMRAAGEAAAGSRGSSVWAWQVARFAEAGH